MTTKRNTPSADESLAAWLGDAAGLAAPDPLTAALDQLYAAGPGEAATAQAQARLRQSLATASQREEPLWYDVLPASPIGPVYVAVSPRGLFAVRFGIAERVFVTDLRRD